LVDKQTDRKWMADRRGLRVGLQPFFFPRAARVAFFNLSSGAVCLSSTGKTLTVSVSSADPEFFGTSPQSDYIQLTRASSSGTFTGGTDQSAFSGSADQITCTSDLLTLPDIHD